MGHAAVYSCPTGSTLSSTTASGSTSTTASGSTSTTSAASPQCPSGYALRGTAGAYYCYLSFGVGSTTTSPTYSCPSGQTLSGSGATSSCLQTLYNSATLVKSSGCPAGYDTTATQCLLSASKVDTAGITTTKTDRQLDFAYGPEHQRITSQVSLSSAVPSTLHAGTTWYLHSSGSGAGNSNSLFYEKEVRTSGLIEHKHYLSAAGQLFAIQILREGTGVAGTTSTTTTIPASTLSYLHSDTQGSIVAVSHSDSGAVMERLAYDPWGKRRNHSGPADPKDLLVGSTTERGYTRHEHLEELALIHMNARVYDPTTARFMSADPVLQNPYNLQSHNRYSYVMNNPLGWVDPSGNEADGSGYATVEVVGSRWGWSWSYDGGGYQFQDVSSLLMPSGIFNIRIAGSTALINGGNGGPLSMPVTAANAGNPRAVAAGLLIGLAQSAALRNSEVLQKTAQVAKTAGNAISKVIMRMSLPLPLKAALGLMMAEQAGEGADKPADPGKSQSGDREALGEIVRDETNGGRKPLAEGVADTILDWARELGIPGVRDDRDKDHWKGGPHIHVPGTGVPHIPAK